MRFATVSLSLGIVVSAAILVSLLAACCKCPEAEQVRPKAQTNPRGQSREFEVANFSEVDEAEVDTVARFVEGLNRTGHDIHDIDAITKIVFCSPARAEVYFLWAGRFHGGMLELAKQNGAWVVIHEARYP